MQPEINKFDDKLTDLQARMVDTSVYCWDTDFVTLVDIDLDYEVHRAADLDQMEGLLGIDLGKDLKYKFMCKISENFSC